MEFSHHRQYLIIKETYVVEDHNKTMTTFYYIVFTRSSKCCSASMIIFWHMKFTLHNFAVHKTLISYYMSSCVAK